MSHQCMVKAKLTGRSGTHCIQKRGGARILTVLTRLPLQHHPTITQQCNSTATTQLYGTRCSPCGLLFGECMVLPRLPKTGCHSIPSVFFFSSVKTSLAFSKVLSMGFSNLWQQTMKRRHMTTRKGGGIHTTKQREEGLTNTKVNWTPVLLSLFWVPSGPWLLCLATDGHLRSSREIQRCFSWFELGAQKNGSALPATSRAAVVAVVVAQPTTHNRQPATGNRQPATCNLQPATCNLQPATCNLQPATCNHYHQ